MLEKTGEKVTLNTKYHGPLRVTLVVGAEIWGPYLKDPIDTDSTLFDYVGGAAAEAFTNLTTRLEITTSPTEWEVRRLDPDNGVLEVIKTSGEQWELEPNDSDRLRKIYGVDIPESDDEDDPATDPAKIKPN